MLKAVERDRPFYDETGGGVTFSGGEPLFQSRFLLACLTEIRRLGLHTVVDTSGFASQTVVRDVAKLTNLFLFDLKVLDEARHRQFTGVPLAPILRNLRALDQAGAAIWIRVPLVPGYNDDPANLEALAHVVGSLEHQPRVHLLPFHRLGADKRVRLGRSDPLSDLASPTPSMVEDAARFLRSFQLDVRVGG